MKSPIWIPLHSHGMYSTLDALTKPKDFTKRLLECGYTASAITEHGNVAGVPAFMKGFEDAKKADEKKHKEDPTHEIRDLKLISGNEIYLCKQDSEIKEPDNRELSHLVVLATNKAGWSDLVQLTSDSNHPRNYYYKPRLNLDKLRQYTAKGNLVSFSGHPGSDLANVLFEDPKVSYRAMTLDGARSLVKPTWREEACALALRYQEIFGKGNFFIEIQLVDRANLKCAAVIADCLRMVSADTGIPCVATADSHYAWKEQAIDQRIILCSSLRTTLRQVNSKLTSGEDVMLGGFFKSNCYHIPDQTEMAALHEGFEHELAAAVEIANRCERYSLFSKPMLPAFDCPNGMSPDEYLKQLCRDGWKNLIGSRIPKNRHGSYADRIKHEFDVIFKAGLSSYFLIVADIMDFCRKQGWLTGSGRGSAAGCLVSYLLGITTVDPLEYGLIFERFYNDGRNTADNIAMPDIDMDIPAEKRGYVIDYIRQKYGGDRVSHIITFGCLKGRSAIDEVFRAHEALSFDEIKQITKHIPDEAEIADELQEMGEDASIIRWALEHKAEELKEYAYYDKDGNMQGPFSRLFEQAIRLENTKKSASKHASGILVSTQPLADICPMVMAKAASKHEAAECVAGFEYKDLEKMGHVKFDVLGIQLLDKIQSITSLIRTGKL